MCSQLIHLLHLDGVTPGGRGLQLLWVLCGNINILTLVVDPVSLTSVLESTLLPLLRPNTETRRSQFLKTKTQQKETLCSPEL